ncbi:MAG TPA: aspartate--tRNA(Asn) ligase [Acidimicrobiales bacterium]|nr:aspartate--tRNA(Asn) ligase [Acidimicrobiales bacterium]
MEERVLSTDLVGRVGESVRVAGWLHHQRQLARVAFVLVRDRRGIVQVVVEDAGLRAELDGLAPETVVAVEGTAVRSDQAPGGVEIHGPRVQVIARPSGPPPPFELRRPELNAQLPTLLDHAAAALRHPRRRAIIKVAAASVAGFRAALDALDFTEVHTPKLVASATETGANVFAVDYFGRRAYLAQSPQFYKQTMVGVLERVYEVGPVFRAEPHDTARHLAEYVSLDAELGFIGDHTDVMAVLRSTLAGMVDAVAALDVAPPEVPAEIPRVDFTAAQHMIEAGTGEPTVGEADLAPAHERWIGEWARREHGSDFVFVTGYPAAKRPFYTHPDPARPGFTNSFDLLFRGIELVTGGQRLHRYDDVIAALGDQDPGPLAGYLDAFRYGMPPHGGFAIGLERWTARLVGAANIREVTLFPRDLNRLSP